MAQDCYVLAAAAAICSSCRCQVLRRLLSWLLLCCVLLGVNHCCHCSLRRCASASALALASASRLAYGSGPQDRQCNLEKCANFTPLYLDSYWVP